MEKYVRLCKTVNTKGKLVSIEELSSEKLLSEQDREVDWYSSLFYYNKEAKDYYEKNSGSLAGFQGKALSNNLFFDFDSTDIEKAKDDVRKLLTILDSEKIDVANQINLFFSGSKGFHVVVETSQEFTPEELKDICSNLAEKLETFDSQIYNTTRLIRLPNTKHNKTGLYKIQLDPFSLKNTTVEQIKQLAINKIKLKNINSKFDASDLILKYKTSNNKAVPIISNSVNFEQIRGLDVIDFSRCPSHIPRCIYALSKGIMLPGERSRIFFRLATFYRNQGMDKEVAYNTLKGISRLNSKLYPEAQPISKEELWNQHISSVYNILSNVSPGGPGTTPDNELIEKYCESIKSTRKCILHKNNETEVIQIGDVSESFTSFAQDFDKNIVKTGIGIVDDYMSISVGTTTLLVGATGSGKTSVALNIMENANRLGQYTMMFSLDMNKNMVFLKLAKKLTNYTQDEIFGFYKNKRVDKINDIKKKISEFYGKTFFDFTASLTIEEMRDKVRAIEEKSGKKIRLVIVDYAGRVDGPKSDSYQNAKYNAIRSTEIAVAT